MFGKQRSTESRFPSALSEWSRSGNGRWKTKTGGYRIPLPFFTIAATAGLRMWSFKRAQRSYSRAGSIPSKRWNPSTTAAACTTLRWACHNGNGYRSHMEADFFPEGFKGWQPSLQKGPMRPDKKRPVQTSPTKREPVREKAAAEAGAKFRRKKRASRCKYRVESADPHVYKNGGNASCSHKPSFWNRYAVR